MPRGRAQRRSCGRDARRRGRRLRTRRGFPSRACGCDTARRPPGRRHGWSDHRHRACGAAAGDSAGGGEAPGRPAPGWARRVPTGWTGIAYHGRQRAAARGGPVGSPARRVRGTGAWSGWLIAPPVESDIRSRLSGRAGSQSAHAPHPLRRRARHVPRDFRRFVDNEITPHIDEWERAGIVAARPVRRGGRARLPRHGRPRASTAAAASTTSGTTSSSTRRCMRRG